MLTAIIDAIGIIITIIHIAGTYGNKLDDTVLPTASCTQPTNAVFDGCRYNFLPWENKKPCIAVESFWEDISFRLDTINMLMSMVEMMVSVRTLHMLHNVIIIIVGLFHTSYLLDYKGYSTLV